MSNIKSFNIGDRAVLKYQKNGSTHQAIVQIISTKEVNDVLWFVIKSPINIMNEFNSTIFILDRKQYNVEKDWGVTIVSPESLNPLTKLKFKIVQ
jgi:hypothetical protein